MIVITKDGIAKYAFENGVYVVSTEINILTPDFIVGDLNNDNAEIYFAIENVPEDFTGDKYLFDGQEFTLNPGFTDV